MENINIGKKVEEFRKKKGLSVRELSKLVEVTPSMLSQIENGLANPSIQTLKMLAKALEVPTFSFLLEERDGSELVVRAESRKKLIVEDLAYELLTPDLHGSLAMAMMTIPPQWTLVEKQIQHKGEMAAYIMQGSVRFTLKEESYALEQGDSVKVPPYTRHKWENPCDEAAVVVFAVTPPVF